MPILSLFCEIHDFFSGYCGVHSAVSRNTGNLLPLRCRGLPIFRNPSRSIQNVYGGVYGFKLYLFINDSGELLDLALTPGNTDAR